MKILSVFNYYQQSGGEEQVYAAESALLETRGHTVRRFSMHNDAIDGMNRYVLARKLIWNQDAYRQIYGIVRDASIDVVHFHNTFPLISPAAYYAAKRAGAAVVQTVHNYRMVCPGALLSRDGGVCEDCLGKAVAWPGIRHACYRDSRVQSAAVATMNSAHRLLRTWDRQVDAYIALSEFAKHKLVEGGLPAEKTFVKPNFVDPDPGPGTGHGDFALFAGRLETAKGIDTLLRAWQSLGRDLPLRIVGDGLLAPEVSAAASPGSGIEYLGHRSRGEVLDLMKSASFLVFPSVWYEGFPMTIVEAYACGLPVIASRLGTMATLVRHGVTGLHFTAGGVEDLITSVRWLMDHNDAVQRMREHARREYVSRYSAAESYSQLMRIYGRALARKGVAAERVAA